MPGNENIEKVLRAVGIPVAYRQFTPSKDKSVPDPPYLIYIVSPEGAWGADEKNLVIQRHVTVELYTDTKDAVLERKIENILISTEWSKHEEYIESEALYMVSYEFDITEKLGGNYI